MTTTFFLCAILSNIGDSFDGLKENYGKLWMIHMNPPINITNYDKRRANSERGGNLGLADLSLEELKTILLEQQEAMGLCQHTENLFHTSFLKHWLPKSSKIVYITTRISQLITLILRVVNFFNYYIAAV
jgi:hypothetical protein